MTLNHMRDGVAHDAGRQHLCRYQDQYDNLFYLCKVQCSCVSLLLDAAYCYSSVCLYLSVCPSVCLWLMTLTDNICVKWKHSFSDCLCHLFFKNV